MELTRAIYSQQFFSRPNFCVHTQSTYRIARCIVHNPPRSICPSSARHSFFFTNQKYILAQRTQLLLLFSFCFAFFFVLFLQYTDRKSNRGEFIHNKLWRQNGGTFSFAVSPDDDCQRKPLHWIRNYSAISRVHTERRETRDEMVLYLQPPVCIWPTYHGHHYHISPICDDCGSTIWPENEKKIAPEIGRHIVEAGG